MPPRPLQASARAGRLTPDPVRPYVSDCCLPQSVDYPDEFSGEIGGGFDAGGSLKGFKKKVGFPSRAQPARPTRPVSPHYPACLRLAPYLLLVCCTGRLNTAACGNGSSES